MSDLALPGFLLPQEQSYKVSGITQTWIQISPPRAACVTLDMHFTMQSLGLLICGMGAIVAPSWVVARIQ